MYWKQEAQRYHSYIVCDSGIAWVRRTIERHQCVDRAPCGVNGVRSGSVGCGAGQCAIREQQQQTATERQQLCAYHVILLADGNQLFRRHFGKHTAEREWWTEKRRKRQATKLNITCTLHGYINDCCCCCCCVYGALNSIHQYIYIYTCVYCMDCHCWSIAHSRIYFYFFVMNTVDLPNCADKLHASYAVLRQNRYIR